MRSMRVSLVLLAVSAALAAFTSFAQGEAQRSEFHFRQIAGGFSQPVYVAQPQSEPGRLYVVERAGRIIVLANGKRSTFLDIRNRVESGYDEQGLLSVAFAPGYAKNHRFYVYYNVRGTGDVEIDTFVSRRGRAVLSSRRRLILIAHRTNDNHDGGQLQFGPDGALYAGTGDGGSGGDPPNNSQNLSRKLGKLLRYSRGKWRIAAYGLRNPWRFSFDRTNGDLYIGDVGQDDWEEIDYRPRSTIGQLTNYEWSAYEGYARYKPSRLVHKGTLVGPVLVYHHGSNGCSVSGGYVYRGKSVPAAVGRYFYGDFCSGIVWSLRISGGKATDNHREAQVGSLSSFGQGANGDLYAVSLDGSIYRLTS
jgi:glucose/arabinose dehydrogenase